jgi:hypothetical protein
MRYGTAISLAIGAFSAILNSRIRRCLLHLGLFISPRYCSRYFDAVLRRVEAEARYSETLAEKRAIANFCMLAKVIQDVMADDPINAKALLLKQLLEMIPSQSRQPSQRSRSKRAR